jgi:succinoglycan biosynthesis transport protein ExoP
LSLANDPDFVGTKTGGGLGSRVRTLFRDGAQALGLQEKPADNLSIDPRKDPEKIALDTLIRNLTVAREDVASVIGVTFSWKDPVKAATIVNAIVDTYIDDSVARKSQSTVVARKVVRERVEELKQQVRDADRALLAYKAANNLVGSDQLTLTHGQLNILMAQMTSARMAMADAKTRMERMTGDGTNLAPDNAVITKLRGDLADLSIRANDIEKLVGSNHQAVVKVRNRMAELRQAIADEQSRVAGSFGREYELARARYDDLSESISEVVSSEGANSNKQAQLHDLENAAGTLRELYNRMAQQASDMSRVEAEPSIAPDARILNRAEPPLQTESSKRRWLIVAGGSLLGLMFGAATAFGRSFPFGVFRTPQQVTNATGLPCVILPEIVGADEQASMAIGEYLQNWPYSRFAQTLRSVWARINIAQREAGAKVVGVISSNPGEGKTTFAINLASHFGRHSPARVLLIDADFYRQSLTKSMAPDVCVGLREALEQPTAFSKYVVRKDSLNLDVLPCPVTGETSDATELLGTVKMDQLIEAARGAYDLVIIEVPPIAAIVDYKMIERHCDGFVFVVEWGKTSQRLVLECLSDASNLLNRVLCVVLNKADPSAMRSIEYYKGHVFHAYYGDHKQA